MSEKLVTTWGRMSAHFKAWADPLFHAFLWALLSLGLMSMGGAVRIAVQRVPTSRDWFDPLLVTGLVCIFIALVGLLHRFANRHVD